MKPYLTFVLPLGNVKLKDNTVGSFQVINNKQLSAYKKQLELSWVQKSVLVGSILGDANLRMMKRQAALTIAHSSKQKDYVFWKYNIFQSWVLTPPREENRIYYKDRSRMLKSWRFQSISHESLTRFYSNFYPQGKKIVPANLIKLLTSQALAVWYMDDGSKKTHGRGAFLHTQNFILEDQYKLIEILNKNFGLEARISSHGWSKGKQLFRLYITANSFPRFKALILPYLLPIFNYKII